MLEWGMANFPSPDGQTRVNRFWCLKGLLSQAWEGEIFIPAGDTSTLPWWNSLKQINKS